MNIAISGYGKMGKLVETQCLARHHTVSLVLNNADDWAQIPPGTQVDALIDFSVPQTALDNIVRCMQLKWPMVIGTTGWHQHLDEVRAIVLAHSGTLFHAPNFSIGMNIMFKLNKQMAWLINRTEYQVRIREVHHIHKLDAPSGTAIQLANDLIARIEGLHEWVQGTEFHEGRIPIESIREGEVNGIHEVMAISDFDIITLKHEALSRQGFALGAVLAAEFIQGKTGIFTMEDLLGY